MVSEIKKDGKTCYKCECGKCDFIYDDRHYAEKCENFCNEKGEHDPEMMKHVVEGSHKHDGDK